MHQVSPSRFPQSTDRGSDRFNVCLRPSSLDVQFVDFDNVRFHLSTPDRKTQLLLSMNIRCWDELAQYGAVDVLRREYGPLYLATPEPDYHVSLTIDLEQIPPEGGTYSVTTMSVIAF
jgi:actin related protein 2/3 complex subunit 2